MYLDAIIDLSHHNGPVNLRLAGASGIAGVIHKATQGVTGVDPMLKTNRAKAETAGLLFGAYHFGTADDPAAQAEHFLDTVRPGAQTLLVLDFEHNPSGPSMTLPQALTFLRLVHRHTGHWPGLYSDVSFLGQALDSGGDPDLASCWLWLARYGAEPHAPLPWPTWTLWQYTDGTSGPRPHPVPGIGRCDRSQFNGSLNGLRRLWGVPELVD